MFKYLVSTTETQGYNLNDFCFVPEGELLRFNTGDENCMIGIKCNKATTTMKVAEIDSSRMDELIDIDFSQFRQIQEIANRFEIGSIIEKINVEFIFRKSTITET